MAVYGFHWAIPSLFGVLLAATIWENLGPNWVWYIAAILCLIAIVGFWILHGFTKERFSKTDKNSIEEVNLKLNEEITK